MTKRPVDNQSKSPHCRPKLHSVYRVFQRKNFHLGVSSWGTSCSPPVAMRCPLFQVWFPLLSFSDKLTCFDRLLWPMECRCKAIDFEQLVHQSIITGTSRGDQKVDQMRHCSPKNKIDSEQGVPLPLCFESEIPPVMVMVTATAGLPCATLWPDGTLCTLKLFCAPQNFFPTTNLLHFFCCSKIGVMQQKALHSG